MAGSGRAIAPSRCPCANVAEAPLTLPGYSGQFRLRLPRSLHGWLAARADLDGVSLNTLVVQLLAEARGTHTAVSPEPLAKDVRVTASEIVARLQDGRTISIPLAWSWRLSEATPEQRANFRMIGDGQGSHWPDVDEDISIRGMLLGVPARRAARAE